MDELGRRGEEVAVAYLARSGSRVLARNWRAGRLEIDLVIREGSTIAFVEVKTRRSGPQHPHEAVSRAKRSRIRRAAARWIATHPAEGTDYRFDVVAIEARASGKWRVHHVRGAFTGDDC